VKARPRPGFAIVRIDDFPDLPLTAANAEHRITIKEVVGTKEQADAEVARLNALVEEQGRTGVRYFAQYTRLFLDEPE
jgi:hypothetical protein